MIYPRQKPEEAECQSTQIKKEFLLCVQDYAVFLALVNIFIDDMNYGRKNILLHLQAIPSWNNTIEDKSSI